MHIKDMRTAGHTGGFADLVRGFREAKALRGEIVPAPRGLAAAVSTSAYVNHGRWVADCPFCNGAELVDLSDLRMWCLNCYNAAVDHDWIAVVLPVEAPAVVAELTVRPQSRNQNWRPGERVADLAAENARHLIGRGV